MYVRLLDEIQKVWISLSLLVIQFVEQLIDVVGKLPTMSFLLLQNGLLSYTNVNIIFAE
jgi:hypothetical protein